YFLALTILIGILIHIPGLSYHGLLFQGDHGRELYAARMVLQGDIPYRDFWWMYGPLMPYYYALCFKVLGISIHSVLIGEAFLKLLSGIFIFRALQVFIPALWALMGAVWFWLFYPYFFYTYNHTGAIMLFMAVMYCLFQYIVRPRAMYLYPALCCIGICAFIKVNFGFSLLASFLAAVCLADKRRDVPTTAGKYFYLTALVALPGLILLIYVLLTKDLPLYALRQCFPYFGSDHQYGTSIGSAMGILFNTYAQLKTVGGVFVATNSPGAVTLSVANVILTGISVASILATGLLMKVSKKKGKEGQNILFLLGILLLFYTTSLHEFLFTGIRYRLNWGTPFLGLITFLSLGTALRYAPRALRYGVALVLAGIFVTHHMVTLTAYRMTLHAGKFVPLSNAGVYVNNSTQWIHTVRSVTDYLNETLPADQTFFALPYDPLFYFLTDNPAPRGS
ncbi:MAG: hypothetical protein K8I00_04700, partial [Candidatus Omnitrophica bacterium]|nr:hypothetical protein [Candidatus Omnitrophota bacterium]